MSKKTSITEAIPIASEEAERLLLGRMLQCGEDRKIGIGLLQEQHFFYKEHKVIFSILRDFEAQGKPCDLSLFFEEIKRRGVEEQTRGKEYALDLAQYASTSIYLEEYIQILKDQWAKRTALEEVNKFTAKLQRTKQTTTFLEAFTQKLTDIARDISPSTSLSLDELSRGESYLEKRAFRREYYKKHKKPYVDGVSTGYDEVDELIGGFCNSNFIILAARPGMGKTAIALNFVRRVAKSHPVGIISLEMTAEQLYERLVSMETHVPGDKIREGRSSDEEWARIVQIEPTLAKLPVHMYEGGHFISDVVSRARDLKESKGIKLLVIDYLQLMVGKGESRLVEMANITRELKNLAIELHVPILCLAQLSRKVEERQNHKPVLSDLRESGTIENDADAVMFLMRPDYYDDEDRPNEADLIVAKNRHGQTGDITLFFDKAVAKFESVAKESQEDTSNYGF